MNTSYEPCRKCGEVECPGAPRFKGFCSLVNSPGACPKCKRLRCPGAGGLAGLACDYKPEKDEYGDLKPHSQEDMKPKKPLTSRIESDEYGETLPRDYGGYYSTDKEPFPPAPVAVGLPVLTAPTNREGVCWQQRFRCWDRNYEAKEFDDKYKPRIEWRNIDSNSALAMVLMARGGG